MCCCRVLFAPISVAVNQFYESNAWKAMMSLGFNMKTLNLKKMATRKRDLSRIFHHACDKKHSNNEMMMMMMMTRQNEGFR